MASDVISEAADPILSAIESAVEENSSPTEEQSEAATEVETAPADTEVQAARPPANVEDKPEDEEAAIKALEAELVTKTPGMSRGRIGVGRHQAVLTRNRNKWEAAEKAYKEQIDALKKQTDDPAVKRKLDLISLAETDPDRFFAALKALPQYQTRIKAEIDALAKSQPPPAAAETKPAIGPRPQPDVLLADGRVVYSPEQQIKLDEWSAQQLGLLVSEEIAKVRGEFKPVIEKEKARETQESQQKDYNERRTKMIALLQKAEAEWPGFKENVADIAALVQKPESQAAGMSLHEAYVAIVPSRLVKSQAALEVAASKKATEALQQRVPKETIRPGSVPVAKADANESKTDMEALIRSAIKSAHVAA